MYYFISSRLAPNRLVLDIKNQKAEPNAPVIIDRRVADGHITEFWELVLGEKDRKREYFYIRNNMHAFVVDLKEFCPDPGAEVVVYPQKCDEPDNQLWELVFERGPWYKIRSKVNGHVLEVKGGRDKPGNSVVASPPQDDNDNHQLWKLIPACPEARD